MAEQIRRGGVAGFVDERLGVQAFYEKYGRKAFPVHTTFFLGEMAMFSFGILVVTGIYLGLIYAPSNVEVPTTSVAGQIGGTAAAGQTVPEAYASIQLIESIPVANLFRNVHHWAAHVMVASILLHALRIFFTGTYRKPRELNWAIGVVLLGLSLMAGFVGYALPYDAYAVTATGIGYSIARSIPYVGQVAAELFFGGAFPTLGSLPRLYTIHVVVLPAAIALIVGLHLLIVIKQKHTQPGYARRLAEPGRVLGVPLWPYQALLAGQLLLLLFGGLFLLSAAVPVHPLAAFGPPGPTTPDVKPDWYLLWVYGFLKLVPPQAQIQLPGATLGPDFIGGLLFPAVVFGLMTFAPWLDQSNWVHGRRFEYMEPPHRSPIRMATGTALLTYIGLMCVAAYSTEIGLELIGYWFVTLAITPLAAATAYGWASWRRARDETAFDPTGEDAPTTDVDPYRASVEPVEQPHPAPPIAAEGEPTFADWLLERMAERDLSTMELAAQMEVADGDVEDWLAGRALPDPEMGRRLGVYFDVLPQGERPGDAA
jgi:cytochrome b-561